MRARYFDRTNACISAKEEFLLEVGLVEGLRIEMGLGSWRLVSHIKSEKSSQLEMTVLVVADDAVIPIHVFKVIFTKFLGETLLDILKGA